MKGYWVLPGRYEKYDAEMTIRDAAILVDNNIKLRLGNHYFQGEAVMSLFWKCILIMTVKDIVQIGYVIKRKKSQLKQLYRRSNRAKSTAIKDIVKYLYTRVVTENKLAYVVNLLERYKQAYAVAARKKIWNVIRFRTL